MASDDSRPKVRMLLTIGIVSLFLLLGIKFLLDSYYYDMTETYEHSMIPPAEMLAQTRAEQHSAIDDGKNDTIPVSIAMQTLASKGRDNASPAIIPQPSDDIDALKGWTQTKHDVHLPPQILTTTAPTPPPPANVAVDAGVRRQAGKDGGR